jgi:fructokinase
MASGLTIVGLGEALFDLLPGGKVLGGAPLNVACHAHQLLRSRGGRGVVASRVGSDPLGDEIIADLTRRGMTAEYVQRDPQHPTGTVNVQLDRGQPTYEIVTDVAWDHLQFAPDWQTLAKDCSAVCFGTLAQRSATSREAIWQFLDAAETAIRLLDVNLRQKYFDQTVIAESCRRSTIIKLNEDELPVVGDLLELPGGAPDYRLAQLRAQYDLVAVVYTRGQRGTMIVTADGVVAPPAPTYPTATNADSVGAGDACTAGILAGWAHGLLPEQVADLANQLGAYVASQTGATPTLPPELIARAS